MSKVCASLLVVLFALLVVTPGRGADSEPKWEFLDKDDGIDVWKRDIPGSDMPGFRGQTFIKASIGDIMKTMLDWKKHTEWMYACEESTLLKQITPDHLLMYNRIGAPWPVWDRDVIADTLIERASDGKSVKVTFQNIASELKAVPKKVIRLPKLEGFYKLWEVEPKKTKVMYQVEADVGGSLPRWLARAGAKDLPHVTLEKLRARVEGRD